MKDGQLKLIKWCAIASLFTAVVTWMLLGAPEPHPKLWQTTAHCCAR